MGRDTPTSSHVPHSSRKAARSKLARHSLTHTLPSVFSSSSRARTGIQSTALLTDIPSLPAPPRNTPPPKVALYNTDTLLAARALNSPGYKVGVLNMASPLRPGGGFLQGAFSQEESLCLRTTLYPALQERYYRLPDVGVLYTPDVMVYRDPEDKELSKAERWFVDVASAGMMRFPDVLEGRYVREKDREMVRGKMRMVMRAFVEAGVKRVVLGAWGCGAYGNPVVEVVEAWKSVLVGGKRGMKEEWKGVEEVVFAILDESMAEEWKSLWGDGMEISSLGADGGEAAGSEKEQVVETADDKDKRLELEGAERDVVELKEKIEDMQGQVEGLRNEALKQRLGQVLDGLKAEVVEKEKLVEELEEYKRSRGI